MNKQKLLQLERSIFVSFIVIIFTIIIVSEKAEVIFLPKIQKKFSSYIENNYSALKESVTIKKPNYKKEKFQAKIVSKENKNHFFYLYYENHKIKDTYQKDYVQGKQLLQHIKQSLEKEIKEKTNLETKVIVLSTLDNYTEKVKERIIKEEDLSQLKFYTLETELSIKNWNSQEITKNIISILETFQNKKINPKYYSIIITNQQEVTESIKIEQLTEDFITNPQKVQIITDIMNDNNSKLIKQNKITYQYLNEGGIKNE